MRTLLLQPGQRSFNGGQTFGRHKIRIRGNRSIRKLVESFVRIFDESSAHEHLPKNRGAPKRTIHFMGLYSRCAKMRDNILVFCTCSRSPVPKTCPCPALSRPTVRFVVDPASDYP